MLQLFNSFLEILKEIFIGLADFKQIIAVLGMMGFVFLMVAVGLFGVAVKKNAFLVKLDRIIIDFFCFINN